MESATSSSAATMSSGEKYRMVSESNDLFLHLMKNLQQVREINSSFSSDCYGFDIRLLK